MALAARHGVPVPTLVRVNGPDLVMERVAGTSMLADLRHHPENARTHGRTLANRHHLLDRVPASGHSGAAMPAERPRRLLHGDVHPDNVLLSPSGPVLIDWTNAVMGPAAFDTAQTWLVLACLAHPDPNVERDGARVRRPLLDAFLTHIDQAAAAAVLPKVAQLRIADPATSPAERQRIHALMTQS